jgi:4-hydroxy-tetrahydrodipicolinate reductase
MNLALVGYGKMGKMIEACAVARGHTLVCRVDPFAPDADAKTIADAALENADVVIEFTRPDSAMENIQQLLERGLPTVVGTTGWHDKLDYVSGLVAQKAGSLLWSSNFSLGVNLFYRVAQAAARIMDPYAEYDVGGWESHHNKKADSPSGTAKTLVQKVLAEMTRKTEAVYETLADRPPEAHELHYPSLRVGSVPGTHSLFFDAGPDTIELTHTARSREGFASGAVLAAEWLAEQRAAGKSGVFTMEEVLG